MNTTQSIRATSSSLWRGACGGITTGCLIVLSASVVFLFAQADFSNMVGLAAGTNTPGATIRQLVVPEPAGLGMLGLAGLLLMVRTRCRDQE